MFIDTHFFGYGSISSFRYYHLEHLKICFSVSDKSSFSHFIFLPKIIFKNLIFSLINNYLFFPFPSKFPLHPSFSSRSSPQYHSFPLFTPSPFPSENWRTSMHINQSQHNKFQQAQVPHFLIRLARQPTEESLPRADNRVRESCSL